MPLASEHSGEKGSTEIVAGMQLFKPDPLEAGAIVALLHSLIFNKWESGQYLQHNHSDAAELNVWGAAKVYIHKLSLLI